MKALHRRLLGQLVAPAVHGPPLDAVDAVLGSLGATLPAHARPHLARVVDLPMLPIPHQRAARPIASVDDLVGQVVVETGATASCAFEAVTIVCSAIAASWSADDEHVLKAALPPALSSLFVERAPAPGSTEPAPRPAPAHDLASGAPGATRSLAGGAPGSSRPLASAAPSTPAPLSTSRRGRSAP